MVVKANHSREDSGFDNTFLLDLLARHEKEKKKQKKPWYSVSRKKMLSCCCVVLFLFIIMIVVAVVTTRNASQLSTDTSTINLSPNSSFIATNPIQWPSSAINSSLVFYALMNSTAIVKIDPTAITPSIELSSQVLSQIYTSIQSNTVYAQDKLNNVLAWSSGSLQQLFQASSLITQFQSTPQGLYYTMDSNTIYLYNNAPPTIVYQSKVPFRNFYIASSQLFFILLNDGIQEITASQTTTTTTRSLVFQAMSSNSFTSTLNKMYVVSNYIVLEFDIASFNQSFAYTSQSIIGSIAVNSDLNLVYVYSTDGGVIEVDLASGVKRVVSTGIASSGLGMVYSSKSKSILIGRGNNVEIWDSIQRVNTLTVAVSSGQVDRIILG